MVDKYQKGYYTIVDLVEIMAILRSENGCPWDKDQSHKSIRQNFIEETYEVIEAIDNDDMELLREELGDVLLQVVFHSQIESEKGVFNFDDVANDICKKLIERHPHIFSTVSVNSTEEVLDNWENIKMSSKAQTTFTETLESVPNTLPALMKAQKVGKRASKSGLDFNNIKSALDSLKSEIIELEDAIDKGIYDDISDEMGDVLFSCVNTSRLLKIDAEEALTYSTSKFISRFKEVENQIRLDGKDFSTLSIDELDVYWQKAKITFIS